MRHFLIIIALLTVIGVCEVRGQDNGTSKPLVVSLSPDIDPGSLWIEYQITGSFGGVASFVVTDSNSWKYQIPTSYEGKPAKTMRLIINGPRYKAQIFDFPELKKQDRLIEIRLERRATLEFKGKVPSARLEKLVKDKRLQVRIGYYQQWACDFFGLWDCMRGANPVVSVDLDNDGRFKVELPDFARDPVIATFSDTGTFEFLICDRNTGNIIYRLKPDKARNVWTHVPVAMAYPTEQVFIAKAWN